MWDSRQLSHFLPKSNIFFLANINFQSHPFSETPFFLQAFLWCPGCLKLPIRHLVNLSLQQFPLLASTEFLSQVRLCRQTFSCQDGDSASHSGWPHGMHRIGAKELSMFTVYLFILLFLFVCFFETFSLWLVHTSVSAISVHSISKIDLKIILISIEEESNYKLHSTANRNENPSHTFICELPILIQHLSYR